jgi:predicted porin
VLPLYQTKSKEFYMQKKIIALAIAAAVSAPAFAETMNVNIYGTADLSYDFIDTGTSAAGVAGVNKRNVSSNVSKIGFKGSSKDMGRGFVAIWQVEQQINMDNNGGNTFATRNTFAGLKSDSAGTVLLGRHDTPYKLSTRKLDPFGDSIADNRALLGGSTGTVTAGVITAAKSAGASFDGRQPDVLAYISPSMSGLTGAIAYVNLTETNTTAAQQDNSALSLAGMYNADPFYGSLGYEEHKLDTFRAGGKESAWKLGLGYTMDAFALGFVYENTSDNLGGAAAASVGAGCAAQAAGTDCFGHNAYFLAGTYQIGSGAIKAAYGKAGQLGSTPNSGANQFTLGYDHIIDKNFKLYAIYSRISNDIGSRYAFTQSSAAASTIVGAGASPSVVSLGMKYSF